LRYDIESFKSRLKGFRLEQSRLLDLKINFQKITEKILAYFRAKQKPNGVYIKYEEAFLKEIAQKLVQLHKSTNLIKEKSESENLISLIESTHLTTQFKTSVLDYLNLAEGELLRSLSDNSDEGNITIEVNDNGINPNINSNKTNLKTAILHPN